MELSDKENFIKALGYLQNFCKEPKERYCEGCSLWDYPMGCQIATWPQYWDIDKITKAIYGEEN